MNFMCKLTKEQNNLGVGPTRLVGDVTQWRSEVPLADTMMFSHLNIVLARWYAAWVQAVCQEMHKDTIPQTVFFGVVGRGDSHPCQTPLHFLSASLLAYGLMI